MRSVRRRGPRTPGAYSVRVTTRDDHDDTVLDSLRGAVDPLEARHESDPSAQLDLRTQVVRFFLTGVLSAVVDYGLTMLLLLGFGAEYFVAKSVGFVAGTVTAYLINRRWTFAAEPSRSRFLAVMALYAAMYAVQVGISTGLHHWFLSLGWSEFWAGTVGYVVGQGVATVTNFVVQRAVIFRVR